MQQIQTQQPQVQAQQQTGTARPRSRMYPTQNYLDEGVRREMVTTLNRVLADTTDLATQSKAAHWNVKGTNFYGLHQLFDEMHEVFEAHADTVAERITALGGQAEGTVRIAAANSRVPEFRLDAVTGPECVEQLADHLAVHDANLYHGIQHANQVDDLDTADLLNEISRDVSKQLYFLESHLQGGPQQLRQSAPGQGQGTLLADSQ